MNINASSTIPTVPYEAIGGPLDGGPINSHGQENISLRNIHIADWGFKYAGPKMSAAGKDRSYPITTYTCGNVHRYTLIEGKYRYVGAVA